MQNDQKFIIDVSNGEKIDLPKRQQAGTMSQQAAYIQQVVQRFA